MNYLIKKEAITYLSSVDAVLSALIEKYGVIEQELHDNLFEAIVHCIVSQQLSNKAADCINTRVHVSVGGELTPVSICDIGLDGLKKCGVSASKAKYICELANQVIDGTIDFSLLDSMSDEEAIVYLQRIKGVGLWTAEMIALFSLGRTNIFSYSDVALLNSIKLFHGYKTLSQDRFERLRKKYTPYCSVASIYYYYAYDHRDDGVKI